MHDVTVDTVGWNGIDGARTERLFFGTFPNFVNGVVLAMFVALSVGLLLDSQFPKYS